MNLQDKFRFDRSLQKKLVRFIYKEYQQYKGIDYKEKISPLEKWTIIKH